MGFVSFVSISFDGNIKVLFFQVSRFFATPESSSNFALKVELKPPVDVEPRDFSFSR